MSLQQHKKEDDTLQRNIQVQDAIREMLICPISRQIMTDPVTTPFGQTYDLSSLVQAWNGKNDLLVTDPLTRQEHSRMMTPSWERRKIIAAILPGHTMATRKAGSLIFVFAAFDDGSVELQQVQGAWRRTDGKALPTWLQKRLPGNRAAASSTTSVSGIRQDSVSAGSPSPAYGREISRVEILASAGASRIVLPSVEIPSNFGTGAGPAGGRGAGRGAALNLGDATGPGPAGGRGAGRGAALNLGDATGAGPAGGRGAGRGAALNFGDATRPGPAGGRGAGRGAALNLGDATGAGRAGGRGGGRGEALNSSNAMGIGVAGGRGAGRGAVLNLGDATGPGPGGGRGAGRGAAQNFVSGGVAGPRNNALFEMLAQVAVEEAEALEAEERELDAMLQQQQFKKTSSPPICAGFAQNIFLFVLEYLAVLFSFVVILQELDTWFGIP